MATSCVLLALAGCSASKKAPPKERVVEVAYIVAQPARIPLSNIYTGRAVAHESAEVRPQVAGVIRKRLFTEGAMVEAGQPLYEIDPSLYEASVSQARANLEAAEAETGAADELVSRYRPLAAIEAVSKQDLTNAVSAARRTHAAVAQTRAALDAARTNLRFSTVPAPLSGRIGRSLVTVGSLATTSQAVPLATIQQLDPIFVDVQQSAAEITALRRAVPAKDATASQTEAQITLPDGSPYAHKGIIEFSEVVVDPTTGTVALRIRVPNPDGMVLPGSFVRASFAQSSDPNAFLIPQQAISRDPTGQAMVWIADAKGIAVRRTVIAARTQGANWVVTSGLRRGDKVIVQGTGSLRPDSKIRPVAINAPARPATPAAKAGAKTGVQGR